MNSCSIFCFAETNILSDPKDNSIRKSNTLDNWESVFKLTSHGLCLCYNTEQIQLLKIFDTSESVELLACLVQYNDIEFIIAIVYRKPGALGTFIFDLHKEISKLPIKRRTIILGDFNMDQLDKENVIKINDFASDFQAPFKQLCKFSTHRDGGILDLVLDNKKHIDDNNPNFIKWLATAFSDHFIIYHQL